MATGMDDDDDDDDASVADSRRIRPFDCFIPLLPPIPGCRNTALCNCAILPLATGSISKLSNTCNRVPLGIQSANSTVVCVIRHECTGASACSCVSAVHSSRGNMSDRVDAHCPHLINAGPHLAKHPPTNPNQTFSLYQPLTTARPDVATTGVKFRPSCRHRRNRRGRKR